MKRRYKELPNFRLQRREFTAIFLFFCLGMKLHTDRFLFVFGMKARVGSSGTTARPRVFNIVNVIAVAKICIVYRVDYSLRKNRWFKFKYIKNNG